MDTSPEYILQCEKAERSAPELFYKGIYDEHDYVFKVEGNDLLWWLPRQDQLQIISGMTWQDFDAECRKYDMGTKEQAGICVIMESKYRKKWQNNDWELDNTI